MGRFFLAVSAAYREHGVPQAVNQPSAASRRCKAPRDQSSLVAAAHVHARLIHRAPRHIPRLPSGNVRATPARRAWRAWRMGPSGQRSGATQAVAFSGLQHASTFR